MIKSDSKKLFSGAPFQKKNIHEAGVHHENIFVLYPASIPEKKPGILHFSIFYVPLWKLLFHDKPPVYIFLQDTICLLL